MKKGDRVVVINEDVKRIYGLHKSFYVVTYVSDRYKNAVRIRAKNPLTDGAEILLFTDEVKPYTGDYVNEIIKKHYGL